jgi:prophage regulatory protein
MLSKILRLPSVLEITGQSRSSIYLRVAQGTFPKQVSLDARAIGWRESDVQTWIESLLLPFLFSSSFSAMKVLQKRKRSSDCPDDRFFF